MEGSKEKEEEKSKEAKLTRARAGSGEVVAAPGLAAREIGNANVPVEEDINVNSHATDACDTTQPM